MSFLPHRSIMAAESMLAEYAQDGAKYRTPKWRTLPAEVHLAAALRHLVGWHLEVADEESGKSHALHLVARAAFAAEQEQLEGREPPDPLGVAIWLADLAARCCLAAADDSKAYTPERELMGELLSISARLRRLHVAHREENDGGVEWGTGNLKSG